MRITFDTETTRFPDGSPFRPTNELISWAVKRDNGEVGFSYFKDPDFISELRNTISAATLLIVINGKFDIHWLKRSGIEVPPKCMVWDCQLAEYILSGQTNSFASMEELCERYVITGKEGGLEGFWDQGIETKDIPYEVVRDYNIGDVDRTEKIYEAQQSDPRMSPALHKLILLSGMDLLVLQQMEWNGLKYNKGRSLEEADRLRKELDQIEWELYEIAGCRDINLDSGDHLSCFLFGGSFSVDYFKPTELVYKSGPRKGETYTQNKFQETKEFKFEGIFRPIPKSEVKKSTPEKPLYQTGEPILKQLKANTKKQKRVVELLLRRADLSKLIDSFLVSIPKLMEEQEWGDYIHPQYNQVVARTGRLSCSKPNAQQTPPEVDKFIESRFM
jgi:DNA polymerase I-like protein with 3'-5' exonuclease and polymerase domains